MGALMSALGVFRGLWLAWGGLPGPVRGFILAGAAASIGLVWGEVDGARRCNARVERSVTAAREMDTRISAETKARAEQQTVEGSARETAIRVEVARYTDELATKVVSACTIGRDADRNNDGLRLSDDAPAPVEKPAPSSKRHPRPVPLPPRPPN